MWPWKARETRSTTGSVNDALIAALTGQTLSTASADETAAIEAASSMVARAFASAEVVGDPTGLVTARLLEIVGRALVRSGEAALAIEGEDTGTLRLTPSNSWDVSGGTDPSSWFYRLSLPGAGSHTTRVLPAASVIHARCNVSVTEPWRGRASYKIASATAATAGQAEKAAKTELESPHSDFVPIPGANADQIKQLQTEARKSGVFLLQMPANVAGGPQQGAWRHVRIAPDPSAGHVTLRTAAFNDMLSAIGIPAVLFNATADGTARREAFRQFSHGTVGPWGRLLATELSEKLDADIRIGFPRLYAGDVAGRARSVKSLTDSGMTLPQALEIVGLIESVA